MPNQRLLIIDDRANNRMFMADFLAQYAFDTVQATNGLDAFTQCCNQVFDCILLDLMMPTMDGMAFLCELRKISTTPVIVVSARIDESDIITALQAGADQYITKPVRMYELLARIQAVIRRGSNLFAASSTKDQLLTLDENTHTVYLHNQPIALTRIEYAIFAYMYKRPAQIITRQELEYTLVLGKSNISRSIDMHIHNIRLKIEVNAAKPQLIETIYGKGYWMHATK